MSEDRIDLFENSVDALTTLRHCYVTCICTAKSDDVILNL